MNQDALAKAMLLLSLPVGVAVAYHTGNEQLGIGTVYLFAFGIMALTVIELH